MRQEALDWLHIAEEDLQHPVSSWIWRTCFAAHQAAEKALKAFIIGVSRRTPPRVHDLTELYLEVPDLDIPVSQESLGELSVYYVVSRYPNSGLRQPFRSITRGQAQRAIDTASEVVRNASQLLAPQG